MDKFSIKKQVLNEINETRQNNIFKKDMLILDLLENKDFKQAYNKKQELIVEIGKLEHKGLDSSKLRKELENAESNLQEVIKNLGLTQEIFNVQYDCKTCNDTGFVNNIMCKCFKDKLNQKLLQESGLNFKQLPSFENVDFSIFGNNEKNMKTFYDKMKKFSQSASPSVKNNILIYGHTGVGKTYLVECMANNAINNQVYTVYVSAYELSRDFLKHAFAKLEEKNAILEKYLDAEILIIDDLGSETVYNNITEEYMYLIINERQFKNKKTVITTNITLQQIRDIYGERVFSRIADNRNSYLIEMKNKDLRLKI